MEEQLQTIQEQEQEKIEQKQKSKSNSNPKTAILNPIKSKSKTIPNNSSSSFQNELLSNLKGDEKLVQELKTLYSQFNSYKKDQNEF